MDKQVLPLSERRYRLTEHREDVMSALLLLELIEEEGVETPRLENLLTLGKMALGSKLEVLDTLLSQNEELSRDH